MTGESINYAEILARHNVNKIQAANDLERMLLRGELPSSASVARAIVTLRKPQETADEMFRELGYRRKFERTYENKDGVQIWVCSIWPGHEAFHKGREEEMAFSKEEILALARLIREMEAEENG